MQKYLCRSDNRENTKTLIIIQTEPPVEKLCLIYMIINYCRFEHAAIDLSNQCIQFSTL